MSKKWLLVLFLLALHVFLLWHSAKQKSATVDEMSHLSAGLYSLTTFDFRMNRVAAPLQNLVCALPVLIIHDIEMPYDDYCWKMGIWNGCGDIIHEHYPGRFQSILMTGRMGTMFLSVLLCFVCFYWAKELWGYWPGLGVLVLAVFEPNILAHGRLITTDIASALFFTLSGFCFWRYVQKPRIRRLLLLGVILGLAWYAKHSGVILFPALFICFLVYSYVHRNHPDLLLLSRIKEYRTGLRILINAFVLISIVFVMGIFTLWVGYGFEMGDSIPGPRKPIHSHLWHDLQFPINLLYILWDEDSQIRFDANNPDEPLWTFIRTYTPLYSHIEGFLANRAHLRSGHLSYFMGERSMKGWMMYYPVLFLIKTPLPVLMIFMVGIGCVATKDVRLNLLNYTACLVIPTLYAYVLIVEDTANIGFRHALPVIPFLMILLGGAFFDGVHNKIQSLSGSFYRRLNWLIPVGLITGLYVFAVLSVQSHYLAYFNSLIGGPRNGHYYAVDSNLDWGQDLLILKRYLDKHPSKNLSLIYFGPEPYPDLYGIPHTIKVDRSTPLEPGWYVISATAFRGIGVGKLFEYLVPFHQRPPDGYITPALLVYKIE